MGEGSIDWLRLQGLRGVEVMDVRAVSRQWAHHHETYTMCAASRVVEDPDVPWRYRRREFVMRLGGTQLMEPGELHANVRCAPVADFGVILIEPPRFLELLDVARGYAGRAPALATAQLHLPAIDRKVHQVLAHVRSGDAQGADDALLELVNAFCDHGVFESAVPPPRTAYERDAIRRAIELIQDAWAEPLTLGEIARGVGVPASTLSHAFKKHVGLGLRQYRLRVRLERARRMLRDRSGDIASIAAECGFFDISAFSHAFKHFFGATPSAYRSVLLG